jgi:hypothetical protein
MNYRRISVSWVNPRTRRWQAVPASGGMGNYTLDLGALGVSNPVRVPANKWTRVDFKFTIGRSQPTGKWQAVVGVPMAYMVTNAKGISVDANLAIPLNRVDFRTRR